MPTAHVHSTDPKRAVSTAVISSADIDSPFQVELFSVSFYYDDEFLPMGAYTYFQVEVSLFLALNQLVPPQSVIVPLPKHTRTHSEDSTATEMLLDVSARLSFDIEVRDLPRATRVMFKLRASRYYTRMQYRRTHD